MNHKPIDIAIVGAGAAGLMTAIWAARTAGIKHTPLDVVLFDSRPKIGAKILMSGGTRCNVTNKEVKPSDFHGGPSHFVKHVFEAFTPRETIQFFKAIGVELILEPTGKYFPVTRSAQTVLDALIKETACAGVKLQTGTRVTEARKAKDLFYLKTENGNVITAKKLILTTGGLSHPTTGSDGTGYGIARSFGHAVTNTFPALTPLLTDDPDWKALSGIALPAKLSFFRNGKKECEYSDSFLFTHFGFSGPAALDISRHFASASEEENPQIFASFLPNYREESLKGAFLALQKKNPNKAIKNVLTDEFLLPTRFVEAFLKKINIHINEPFVKCSADARKRLVHLLLNYPLEITGVFGYKKAEVTAGGVDLKEIKAAAMESKLTDGLYFAGEIMDVDGRIGGFNFQWAWSTGAIAGRSVAKSLIS